MAAGAAVQTGCPHTRAGSAIISRVRGVVDMSVGVWKCGSCGCVEVWERGWGCLLGAAIISGVRGVVDKSVVVWGVVFCVVLFCLVLFCFGFVIPTLKSLSVCRSVGVWVAVGVPSAVRLLCVWV